MVTLPAALLIRQWWEQGRVTQTDLIRLAPFFTLALCITVADLSFYAAREPLSLGYSLAERALIAARALWFYAGKLLWPGELPVIYPLWDIRTGDPLAWAYVVAAAGLAAVLWLGRVRWGRGPLAGALFFAVTLSPTLGFVDYGYMQFSFVADRFQYLAGIGVLAVGVGAAVHGACRLRDRASTIGAGALLVAVVAVLATMTWRQTGIYRDEITFFGHIVSHNPAARGAHHNLGIVLMEENRLDEALAALRIAVEQLPDAANVRSDLGRALLKLERFDQAEEHLRRALEQDPEHLNAQQNYERALQLDPDDTDTLDRFGMLRFVQKRYAEALGLYTTMVRLQPDAANVHANIGVRSTTSPSTKRRPGVSTARSRSVAQTYGTSWAIAPWRARACISGVVRNLCLYRGRSEPGCFRPGRAAVSAGPPGHPAAYLHRESNSPVAGRRAHAGPHLQFATLSREHAPRDRAAVHHGAATRGADAADRRRL